MGGGRGLAGTYKAWLSTPSASPSTRFTPGTGPYLLVSGTEIASSWADVLDGSLAVPINWTERRTPYSAGRAVNTATATNGTFWQDQSVTNCGDWMSTAGSAGGGGTDQTGVYWTSRYAGVLCNQQAHLYCFEQGEDPSLHVWRG